MHATQFQLHKGSKTEAFLQIFKDNIASELAKNELRKEIEELKAYEVYAKDRISGNCEQPTEISEKPCSFMVYVKREPKCGDPDAPIESFLKRHLNPQICALCQRLKRIKENAIQKKQDEEKEKQLQKLREQSNRHMNSIKKTLGDDFKGEPRVNYDTSNPYGQPIWTGE